MTFKEIDNKYAQVSKVLPSAHNSLTRTGSCIQLQVNCHTGFTRLVSYRFSTKNLQEYDVDLLNGRFGRKKVMTSERGHMMGQCKNVNTRTAYHSV